jgi:acetyl esterase/lipase
MTPSVDVRPLIDAEVAALLDASPIDVGAVLGGLTLENLADVRAVMADRPIEPLSDDVVRTDHVIDEGTGVSVRVHRPLGVEGRLPCVYWIHGGGYVLGSNVGDDLRFDRWCPELRCVGVSVEYRLAPVHPYPIPLDDCYAGLAWVHAHADEIGVDPDRIAIGGASAGGGLAAGLALLARDRGELAFTCQVLLYPMIDDRQITPSSGWIDPIWPPTANTFGWTSYVGAGKGGPDVPAYAAPARATELAGLPPTLISVGAIDGFCDEDVDYATRLRQAGIPVELHVYPGAPHGFDGFGAGSAIARRANRDMTEWLSGQLA